MTSLWKGKTVLITGHTGFKGSWLSLWMLQLGAKVIGYALEPLTTPSLFNTLKLEKEMVSVLDDIRNKEKLEKVFNKYKPEIIFHLAAQPIVRKSYEHPLETLETNIMGTANLLEVCRKCDSVRVIVNITTDKCYENKEWPWGYREIDTLGGYDPYSCSKASSELITSTYRESFLKTKNIQLASARAGNVIGGGDWAEDRLVPDIIRALKNNESPLIRNPYSIRPWQHVLEPLSGYMILAEKLWESGDYFAEAWNFGPKDQHIINVATLAQKMFKLWTNSSKLGYGMENRDKKYESKILKLDSSKANSRLNWRTILDIDETLEWTVEWYKNFYNGEDMICTTIRQIRLYEELKKVKKLDF